jgi:hypothetical protein
MRPLAPGHSLNETHMMLAGRTHSLENRKQRTMKIESRNGRQAFHEAHVSNATAKRPAKQSLKPNPRMPGAPSSKKNGRRQLAVDTAERSRWRQRG